MHPAFSRFTRFPESLREAGAFVPSRAVRLSGKGSSCSAAALPAAVPGDAPGDGAAAAAQRQRPLFPLHFAQKWYNICSKG